MSSLEPGNPLVSAVVQLASAEEREAAGAPGLHDNQALAQLKAALTKAGFEVHAPFGNSFSIGGKQSLFESTFGRKVVVDDDLAAEVSLEGGGHELPVDVLPDDVRPLVHSVSFVSPPSFHDLAGGAR
jgi:hypothetical protein